MRKKLNQRKIAAKQKHRQAAEIDPRLAAAYARGKIAIEKVKLDEGGALSTSEAARLLQITEPDILRRWQRFELIGWRESGAVFFPIWQFKNGKLLDGVTKALKIMRSHDDWRVMFFSSRNDIR